jgi:hypothetical protein
MVQAEDYPAGALCVPPSDPAPPHTQQQPGAVQEPCILITSHADQLTCYTVVYGPLQGGLNLGLGEPCSALLSGSGPVQRVHPVPELLTTQQQHP